MMSEVSEPSIERYRQLYEQADHYTRAVSLLALEAVIPAHNQLRYAGYHLHKALGNDGHVECEDELSKAIGHCARALYEASETGIIVALEKIKSFEDDYRGINISSIIPEIREIRALRREANHLLSRPRPKAEKAPDETAEYMEVFMKLRERVFLLDDNRHDLDAERDKEKILRRHQLGQWAQAEIAERNRTIRWLVTTILAIICLWIAQCNNPF